jgi:hypothetical protein
MLGNTIRRINNNLYFKDDASKSYFNPSCGFSSEYRDFIGIGFSTKDIKLNSYFINLSIPSSFSNTEFQQLDQVLQSIKGV